MLQDGDLIELHFHGTLDDGAVFDSSRGRSPRFFVIGAGQLIPAFERALLTMHPGETRTIRITAAEAYGERERALVFEAPREEAPPDAAVGDEVSLVGGRPARITAMTSQRVTVDGNHPFAGHALNFEIQLISVRPRSEGIPG